MTDTILTEAAVLDALRQVIDPEIGCNLVDLGMIYNVALNGGSVRVTMTLTSPGCPMSESIAAGVRHALLALDGVLDAEVELTFDPPWHPAMMTEAGREMTGTRF
jgi:metal-sulfur cluster biosynthetic enzyme